MDTIAETILEEILEKEVDAYSFPVTLKAKTLAVKSDLDIDGKVKPVDHNLLFQRLAVFNSMSNSDEFRSTKVAL